MNTTTFPLDQMVSTPTGLRKVQCTVSYDPDSRHITAATLRVEDRNAADAEAARAARRHITAATLRVEDQCPQCSQHEDDCRCRGGGRTVFCGVNLYPLALLAMLLLSGCNGKGVDMPPLLQGLLVVCLGGVAVMAWLMRRTASVEGGKPASGQSVMEAMRRSQAKRLRERRQMSGFHEDEPKFYDPYSKLNPLPWTTAMPANERVAIERLRQRLADDAARLRSNSGS